MRNVPLQACLLMATLTFAASTATAQEVVHALTGVVTSINPKTKTIHIDPDDGSAGLFNVLTGTTPLEFQKDIRAASTPAASFTKNDAHVIVFYFGDDVVRTTVALQDLGPGPFDKTIGSIVKFDKHAHALTIRNASGEQTFHIDAKTVADASEGVVTGEKFPADKGAQVRVISSTTNGVQTAVFIRALSL